MALLHQTDPLAARIDPIRPPEIQAVLPARAERPRRPTALLVVATFLIGALVGGVAGATASDLTRRAVAAPVVTVAPTAAAPSRAADDSPLVAAVSAVLPAVVTVEDHGTNGATIGTGSGVIIDQDLGYVVTNSHVIEQLRTTQPARSIDVILGDGTRRAAAVIGNAPQTDVAVLRVAGPLPAQAALADSDEVPLGAQVVAIGSPGLPAAGRGVLPSVLQNTVTSGIVSAKGRQLPRADLRNNVMLTDLIQTDAPINPGNSGGPLVWVATRQVIGLNTLVVRGSGEEGLGFAVSSATVRDVAAQLIAKGTVSR